MSTPIIVLPTEISVHTSTEVVDQQNLEINANFEAVINIKDWDTMFNTKTYQQNSSNQDAVDIVLDFNSLKFQESVSGTATTGNVGGLSWDASVTNARGMSTDASSLGFRLLEISAFRIFDHALARAAIANDTQYIDGSLAVKEYGSSNIATTAGNANVLAETNLYKTIADQLQSAFNTDRHAIFNQYVEFTELSNANIGGPEVYNDVTGSMAFNFKGFDFKVKLNFKSDTVSDRTKTWIGTQQTQSLGVNSTTISTYNVYQRIPAQFTDSMIMTLTD